MQPPIVALLPDSNLLSGSGLSKLPFLPCLILCSPLGHRIRVPGKQISIQMWCSRQSTACTVSRTLQYKHCLQPSAKPASLFSHSLSMFRTHEPSMDSVYYGLSAQSTLPELPRLDGYPFPRNPEPETLNQARQQFRERLIESASPSVV